MKEKKLFNFFKQIENIYRSITGPGNLKTLKIIRQYNNSLKILKFKSGKKVYDWKIPKVWTIKNAFVRENKSKKIILSFKKNMLSVVGFSHHVNLRKISKNNLLKNIFTLKNQPQATPYVTSYYKKNWGFCMSENEKKKLKNIFYDIKIESKFAKGNLHVGEIYLKGKTKKEILISTYICHPKMANNEISGPAIALFISIWLKKMKNRKFSYRFIFSSETIGTIAYIHKRYNLLKKVIGGYVLTCLGDNKCFSYLKTKNSNSISDKIAFKIFKDIKSKKIYEWIDRGSDERQYNSQNIELNIGSIMRTKYGNYKEYHTDQDKFGKLVTDKNLNDSLKLLKKLLLNLKKKNTNDIY